MSKKEYKTVEASYTLDLGDVDNMSNFLRDESIQKIVLEYIIQKVKVYLDTSTEVRSGHDVLDFLKSIKTKSEQLRDKIDRDIIEEYAERK